MVDIFKQNAGAFGLNLNALMNGGLSGRLNNDTNSNGLMNQPECIQVQPELSTGGWEG